VIRFARARSAWLILLVFVASGLSSCASSGGSGGGSAAAGAATSEMAVRDFLDAANAEDYNRMIYLFGTADGLAVDEFGIQDVEARMIFLSQLLKHESYTLTQANFAMLGPDRVRYEARMSGTRKGSVIVPVIAIPDSSGRWYVERLNLDALTAGI
jgi:hypothetical protein